MRTVSRHASNHASNQHAAWLGTPTIWPYSSYLVTANQHCVAAPEQSYPVTCSRMDPSWFPGATLVATGLAAAVPIYFLWQPIKRWRLSHVPGPFAYPLIGNLPQLAAGDATLYQKDLVAKYGKIFKIWIAGTVNVMISDPVALRKLLLTHSTRPHKDQFVALTGDVYHVHRWNLIFLAGKDPKFKTFRKVFEHTLLSPSSLASHGGMLAEIASRLVRHVTSLAASGETFDALPMFADLAMEAVGFAAWGLDLNCLGEAASGITLAEAATNLGQSAAPRKPSGMAAATKAKLRGSGNAWLKCPVGSPEFSEGLVRTCRDLINQTDMSQASLWALLNMFFPDLCRPLSHVANWLPDGRLKRDRKTRQDLVDALRLMIQEWERGQQSKDAGGVASVGMSDRGFLPQLLATVSSGQDGITELDIIAQGFLSLMAGYETTTSALSITLHLLSTHLEVQQRAQQEVDTVLQGKNVTPADLERLPYIKAVFEETLRLYPMAAPVIMRELAETQDVEIDGKTYRLPAGTEVVANAYEMQRNAAYWPRPDEFLPERHIQPGNEAVAAINSQAYIPFGHGPRMCPGYRFAQLEAHLALAKLMQNFTFKPAPGCPPPKFKSGFVYSPDHVWLVAKRRKAGAEQ